MRSGFFESEAPPQHNFFCEETLASIIAGRPARTAFTRAGGATRGAAGGGGAFFSGKVEGVKICAHKVCPLFLKNPTRKISGPAPRPPPPQANDTAPLIFRRPQADLKCSLGGLALGGGIKGQNGPTRGAPIIIGIRRATGWAMSQNCWPLGPHFPHVHPSC